MPDSVRFGAGARASLTGAVDALGKRAFIVADPFVAGAKGANCSSVRSSTESMSVLRESTRASIVDSKKPWWSLKRPMNASCSWHLDTQPGSGLLAQMVGRK